MFSRKFSPKTCNLKNVDEKQEKGLHYFSAKIMAPKSKDHIEDPA